MDTPDKSYVRVAANELKRVVTETLLAHEVPEEDAHIVADVLVASDLRGIESHGVARLSSYYLEGLKEGRVNVHPDVRMASSAGSVFCVDADNGLGHPVCHRAMERCISLALENGISAGAVRNSNHYGIAGYYAMLAAKHDLIGVCLTNSRPLVIPTYGRTPVLGTNPISVAVPAGDRPPFVLDMATSAVPIGRVEVLQRKNQRAPSGWGADRHGLSTDDPTEIREHGGLFPLGGTDETSGYKGYGLGAVVDILSGVLSGAAFLNAVGSATDADPSNVGHFVAALQVEALMGRDEFFARMQEFMDELKESPRAQGAEEIYLAGEKEHRQYRTNLREGAPLHPQVYRELLEECSALGVQPPQA